MMATVPGSVQVSCAGLCHRDGPGWVPAPRGVSCMDVLEPSSHSLRGTGAACPGALPAPGKPQGPGTGPLCPTPGARFYSAIFFQLSTIDFFCVCFGIFAVDLFPPPLFILWFSCMNGK